MKSQRIQKFKFITIIVAIILIIIGLEAFISFNDHMYVVTIVDKDRITDSKLTKDKENKIESKYIVFAEDESGKSRVFENTDKFIRFKWNSSDVQGSLKINHKYKLTVVGHRIPFMSVYENIIKVEEIK